MSEEQEAAIRQRQQYCNHAFIKGAADQTFRCPHCGISKADYENAQASLAALFGGSPYPVP